MIPHLLKSPIENNFVLSIIQFGSSLYKRSYNDIDLAVIIKNNTYEDFRKSIVPQKGSIFDIALIKEKEAILTNEFRWGSHGVHMLKSMSLGKAIFGDNIFRNINISELQIKRSIKSRLYDYMEDVRRSVFKKNIDRNIIRRWKKFLRLSLYLLDTKLVYPNILYVDHKMLNPYINRYKINIRNDNLLCSYESLWEIVLDKELS